MSVRFYLKLYALTVPVFLAVDLLWLGVVARPFYQAQLAHLLSVSVNWLAAGVFYLLYVAGILIFAVVPGLRAGSLLTTAALAAGFGFFTYMTYELTNMATLPRWPLAMVLVDTLWGVVLCTIVASIAHLLALRLR